MVHIRFFDSKLSRAFFALAAGTLALLFGTKIFEKAKSASNQKAMDGVFAEGGEIAPLLNLKHLSAKQKCGIYNALALDYFSKNKMQDFLSAAGYALYYNHSLDERDKEVHLYSLLSQYYLGMGAEQAGFNVILHGRRLKNFYTIEDKAIRSQALHAYGRFLVYESDFESALKAEKQMEDDAADDLEKCRALMFKAYILMMQGKTDDAKAEASAAFSRYAAGKHEWSSVETYDILLPYYWSQTHAALRSRDYDDAVKYCKEYEKAAKKYGFIMKTVSLSKDVLFALPAEMTEERSRLFYSLALDSDSLSLSFLEHYADTERESLDALMTNLKYSEEKDAARRNIAQIVLLAAAVFFALLTVLINVYSETQIDALTKLRNRRALNVRLGKLAASGRRYSAIMVDIDNFKRLNDNFGHDFGDEVLQGVAAVLLRNEGKNVKCYRYGGEEMTAILEHFTLEQAVRFSEKIRVEIAELKWRKDVRVTASFGLGFEVADSVKEADENMYVAKQKGKNFTAYKKDGVQYLAERRLDIRNPMPDKF